MLLLLRAVYPRAIVDQITVRGNGRENPVEIGLLVIVLSRIEIDTKIQIQRKRGYRNIMLAV